MGQTKFVEYGSEMGYNEAHKDKQYDHWELLKLFDFRAIIFGIPWILPIFYVNITPRYCAKMEDHPTYHMGI